MKIDEDQIRMINALESISGVSARDCVVDREIVSFLVPPKDVGKAIGKKAVNVKKLNDALGKKIEILSYNQDFGSFLKAAMSEINFDKVNVVEENGSKEAIVSLSPESKIKIRERGRKLKRVKMIAERNYNIGNMMIR